MASNNGSAEIVELEDARARRQAAELPGANYENAGAHLKAVRDASGLTIIEAASRTHIKEAHLEAIEALDADGLPPRPYAIGFVKTYAEFLGLDGAQVVARFKDEAGYSALQPISVEKFEEQEAKAEEQQGELSLIAVALIMAFILWCAWQITRPHEVTQLGAGGAVTAAPENAEDQVISVIAPDLEAETGIVVEARSVERIDPVFPRRCAGGASPVETVIVSFNVTAEGRVAGERVAQTTNACLNDAALNAIRRWRFEPKTVNGAVRPSYDQQYSFAFQRPR